MSSISLGRCPPKKRADGSRVVTLATRCVLEAREGVARRMRAEAMVACLGLW